MMGHDAGDVVATEAERVAVDAGRGVDELAGLSRALEEQLLAMVVEFLGVHLAVGAEIVDETLGRTGTSVVAIEAPGMELVATQVDLQGPSVHVVEAQVAAVESGFAGSARVDDLLSVLDRHDRRAESGLQEAHAARCRSVEQGGEHGRLFEAADVDHLDIGHEFTFSIIFGKDASHKVSVCFSIYTR